MKPKAKLAVYIRFLRYIDLHDLEGGHYKKGDIRELTTEDRIYKKSVVIENELDPEVHYKFIIGKDVELFSKYKE
jgi:hypothetical protein